MAMKYRLEQPIDLSAIHRVVAAAFGREDEAELVDRLRDHGRAALSAVAVADAGARAGCEVAEDQSAGGEIVGHILFSPLAIEGHPTLSRALALAPLAVLPAWQGKRVGTALTEFALAACRTAGHRVAFVLGHPNYYPRFGFRCELAAGFACPYAGDHFMGLELAAGALAVRQGTIIYPPEFG